MIEKIQVLGGGSAGLLAATALKTHRPKLHVSLLQSSSIPTIRVGEGTFPDLPNHLHGYLGIDPKKFHEQTRVTYKLGGRFLWGPRDVFYYSFADSVCSRVKGLRRPSGFYCYDDFEVIDPVTALMANDRCFVPQQNGAPDVQRWAAYHIENHLFVELLEKVARDRGVEFIDGTVAETEKGPGGIAALQLVDGRRIEADFYVDCSGFRSELLGKALEEPFISYDDSLFSDRALAGGWGRDDEPILPYTTVETMSAGWSWQIEHESRINRGYVFSSAFLSDDEAEAEFRKRNPKLGDINTIPYQSGRFQRSWVGNVLALGNSAGFVEPLQATAIFAVCNSSRAFVSTLIECDGYPTPTTRDAYNKVVGMMWDEIRDFLALHYRFNTRIDTPFWRHCLTETALHGAEPIVQFYRENGPSHLCAMTLCPPQQSIFQLDGFYSLLLGQQVPHARLQSITPSDQKVWKQYVAACRNLAGRGLTMEQTLEIIRGPHWQWKPGFYNVFGRQG